MNAALLIARKEAGEVVASPRGRGWLLMVSAALSGFALLLVSNTELSLLDEAEVVYGMVGIVTGLGALLAIILGADAIAGERERGSLVPLLVSPVSRRDILVGKAGGQVVAWFAMLALTLPYLWSVGSTGEHLVAGAAVLAALGTPVVLGFGFFAIALGAGMSSARAAATIALVVLAVSATPIVLGPSFRQSVVGSTFDALNPFSNALNAYDAILVDGQAAATQALHGGAVAAWFVAMLCFARVRVRRLSR